MCIRDRQNRIEESQDFSLPPNGYFLLGFQAGTSVSFGESDLKISLRAENILNETYRDYLNRLRYFADENGTNVSLNLGWSF